MRHWRIIPLLAWFLLFPCLMAHAAGTHPGPGRLVPSVSCIEQPGFSYALYLPSTYSPDRTWPVMFAFSPFGNGVIPVQLLSDAAEKYGYIVVGSNDSRNGHWDPIVEAQNALWRDVTARFPVDLDRCYATGFSGGARSAFWFALDHPDSVAGVILCGAVFPRPRNVPTDGRLAIFGLVGDADLNLTEHLEVEELLEGTDTEQWQEVYTGWHQWPTRSQYTEAVEFMELAAMQRGLIPMDNGFVAGLAAQRLGSARALELAGKPLLALRKYRQVASCFRGSAEGDTARMAARILTRQRATRKLKRLQAQYLEEVGMIKAWLDQERFSKALVRLRRRAGGGGPFAVHARLALHLTSVRLTEMAMKLAEQDHLEEAEAFSLIGIVAYPENPYTAFHASRYSARLGKYDEAVQFLENAAAHNFDRLDLLQTDPDIQRARFHPDFHEIEEAISRNRARGVTPVRYYYSSPVLQGEGSHASGSPGEGFDVIHGMISPTRG